MTTQHPSNVHRRGVLGGLVAALAGLGTLLARPRPGLGAPEAPNGQTMPDQRQQSSGAGKPTQGGTRSRKPPIWIGHI